jgi:glutamyl-tRNA synthetase
MCGNQTSSMPQTGTPRVRFAPSPTGYLHIGGARTVLFNWLHARKTGGTFIVRIEDTDQARSSEESTRNILDAMRWLGLEWDEGPDVGGPYGPYTQTERLSTYREHADRLVAEGKAYRCYATKEELDALRRQLPPAERDRFVYPRLWRDKSEKDWPADKPYVVRFKTPLEGRTVFRDKVFGEISTPNSEIQDFVLTRSDGLPLYNFGAVVDDVLMKITLVARGSDHIVNTPQQILLYQALSYPVPEIAHLPMILGPNGKKMGKRDGEKYGIPVSVMLYKDLGYSPLALLNYLVRFGWSHGDQEIFTREELIEYFSFEQVRSADGRFDLKKCQAICHRVLKDDRYTPLAEYTAQLRPFLAARGLTAPDEAYLQKAIAVVRQRATTFADCADRLDYFLRPEPVFDEEAAAAFLTGSAAVRLRELVAVLQTVDPFEVEAIERAVQAYLTSRGLEIKDVAQAARVALSGRSATPGLFEVIEVLGKEVTLARLEAGARRAEKSG